MSFRIPVNLSLAAVALQLAAGSLPACPVCLGVAAPKPTFADHLRTVQDAVLASADADGLAVQAVFKGDATRQGKRILAPSAKGAGPFIVTRASERGQWESQGTARPYLAAFISMVLQLPERLPTTDAEWTSRLERSRPYLGHPDPRLGRSAWAEWAQAPYGVLRVQRLEFAKLRAWLAEPTLSYGQSLWAVLLGLSAEPADVRRLQQRLEEAWRDRDDTILAALLTASMERGGTSAVSWLEDRYFRDRTRTLEEVQAAVAALSVQGEVQPSLRPKILAACFTLIAERPLFSGLVAEDLTRWQDWSAEASFRGLLASDNAVLVETRPKIEAYLQACQAAERAGSHSPSSRRRVD